MSDYVVCLDTSMILDVFDECLKTGHEPPIWIEFKSLIDRKEATLLVPEIVLLEFDKGVRERLDTVKIKVVEISGCAGKDEFLQEQLETAAKIWRIKKEGEIAGSATSFKEWLSAHMIPFTETIAHKLKKRVIARNFPVPLIDPALPKAERDKLKSQEHQWLRDQDCAIIETLIDRFGGNVESFILVFGTSENVGFGQIREDGYGNLDNTFRRGLPATQMFKDLRRVIDYVKKKKKVKFLSEQDVERIKKENELRDQMDRFYSRYCELLEVEKNWQEIRRAGPLPHPQYLAAFGHLQPSRFDNFDQPNPDDGLRYLKEAILGRTDPPQPPEASGEPEDPNKGAGVTRRTRDAEDLINRSQAPSASPELRRSSARRSHAPEATRSHRRA